MSWGDLRNELLTLYARNAQRIRSNDRFLLRLILLLPVKVFRDSFRFDPPYSRWNRNQSAHSLRRFLIFANFANCQHTFREEQGELMVLFGPKTATFRENVFLITINLVVFFVIFSCKCQEFEWYNAGFAFTRSKSLINRRCQKSCPKNVALNNTRCESKMISPLDMCAMSKASKMDQLHARGKKDGELSI